MRKLACLCRRLKRTCGICAIVVSHGRGRYAVNVGEWSCMRQYCFGTVRECEDFLLSLFNGGNNHEG